MGGIGMVKSPQRLVFEAAVEMFARLEKERDEASARADQLAKENGDLLDQIHDLRSQVEELKRGTAA